MVKVNVKVVFILVFLVLVFIPAVVGIAWLSSYGNLFPAVKFSSGYKHRLMRSPTVFVDRNNDQLGSIGGSSDFHIQKVSASTHDLSTLSKILFAKEDRKIKDFDGIQRTGMMGTVEAALEVISWRGKLRAVYQTFSGNTQGASGLLEQIAGNLYAHDNQNPWFRSGLFGQIERKIVKTINAARLAHLYRSPQHVVEDYINLTYSAGMYHGINAFMLQRFNRNINQILVPIDLSRSYLTDREIDIVNMLAYYVGQLTGPSNYDPEAARNPTQRYRILKRAEFKKNLVLNQMYDLGMIAKTVHLKATDRKLPFKVGSIAATSYDPNIEVLRREIIDQVKLNLGGNVRTTLIKEVHDYVNYELLKHRTKLSLKATGVYVPSRAPILKSIRPKLYGIYRVKVVRRKGNKVTVSLGIRMGNRSITLPRNLKPTSLKHFAPGRYISVGVDGFNAKGLPVLALVQTDSFIKGATILKNLTNGQVIAFGGGGYLKAAISPGSAFKPFLLKMAFDYDWQLEDRLNNGCYLKYRLFSAPYYSPKNYGRCDESKPGFERYPDLKSVLKRSINKPVVYLLDHLTDQLPEKEFRTMADRVIKHYHDKDLNPLEYVYLIKSKSIDFFLVTDDGGKQFVGKIALANLKNRLIYEQMKREKYLALNEGNHFLLAAEVLDQDYKEFLRWHSTISDINDQIEKLKQGLEAYQNNGNLDTHSPVSEVASLEHFYYDDSKNLHYDPYTQDKISFVNWELVKAFLEERSLAGTYLGKFTLDDHQRYDSWVEDYGNLSDQKFFEEMYYFHPQVRGLVNIELFKAYLADLTGTEKKSILGNYSLPLGTHRVSLVKLSEMYGQILTTDREGSARNNRTYFIEPTQAGFRNLGGFQSDAEFVLNQDTDVFAALKAARQEKGGTSFHLISDEIIAGKTGTDPKYKTYAAVVRINGVPYLFASWFGVDHNKHEKLVKSWTGGWTAAVHIDKIVSTIRRQYLDLFPKKLDDTVAFDPDFEYDATPDSEAIMQDKAAPATSDEKPARKPNVVWQADGTYRLEFEEDAAKAEENLQPTVEMEYSKEDIDQLIQEEGTTPASDLN